MPSLGYWVIAIHILFSSADSEYGRTIANKKSSPRLGQAKIPYIQTKISSSGPKIPYLWTSMRPF
jgi:hypothetical protein